MKLRRKDEGRRANGRRIASVRRLSSASIVGASALVVAVAPVGASSSAPVTGLGISIVAGTGASGTPTNGPALSTPLNVPRSMAFDAQGNLYVVDLGKYEVYKIGTDGNLTVIAGTGTQGAYTLGPATSSALNYPAGIAVDSADNVYIADVGNNVIEKVSPGGHGGGLRSR